MISEKMFRKKIQRSFVGNYQMNYLREFNLCIDIVLIVNLFSAKILFF